MSYFFLSIGRIFPCSTIIDFSSTGCWNWKLVETNPFSPRISRCIFIWDLEFFYHILESWWKLYIAMHSLLNVMLLCYVHIYNLKIIFWMADMLLFMVTEVHILSFMNTILITEELYICFFKSFYKFGFFFFCFVILFVSYAWFCHYMQFVCMEPTERT